MSNSASSGRLEINIGNPGWNQYKEWIGAITISLEHSGNLGVWCMSNCLDSSHFTPTHVEQKQWGVLTPKLKITLEVVTVTANSKEQVNSEW